jgi:hypothetical protein
MITIKHFLYFFILGVLASLSISCHKELNEPLEIPRIIEIGVTSSDSTSAICMMKIIDYDSTSNVTRGFVCSSNPNPSLEDYIIKTEVVVMNGYAYSTINGLSHGTPYYIKAYAINRAGIAYSEEVQFYTLSKFIMNKNDYMYIASIDPIPHPRHEDQGYYFGASAFYKNFDMRLLTYHLRSYTWESVTYNPVTDDPVLYNIYYSNGEEAATKELFRRIVNEAIISLLQLKFPEAKPHPNNKFDPYIVGFETYNDNLSRYELEAQYRCIAPLEGESLPQFELVDGPRERHYYYSN